MDRARPLTLGTAGILTLLSVWSNPLFLVWAVGPLCILFMWSEVTFLVEDARSAPWQLPVDVAPDAVIPCGNYRILDFQSHPLPLGSQRS